MDLPLSPPSCLATPWAPTAGGCFPLSSCLGLTFLSLCLRSRSSGALSFSRSRGARLFLRLMSSLRAPSDWTQRDSTFFSTVFSMLSRMVSSCLPEGMWEPLPAVSRISSTVTGHFFRYEVRRPPKCDEADEGSTEARTLGNGVVLRLRGVCEGLEPGFVALALPLRPVGAMSGVWWVEGEGEEAEERRPGWRAGALEYTGKARAQGRATATAMAMAGRSC